MSDSKLHLMSFAPVPDTKTTVHVVGLPDSLRDALFTLMPPRKEGGYLNTKVLKDDLRCWLDRAVELNPVRPNVHTDSWLIALAPIDLAKLCNVIAVWISSRKDIDTQSPAYRKVMGMLHPETFEEAVRGEEIRLFSGDGRPTGRLTFPAFSAQVADAIADIPLELANGMVENFSRVSRGNGNVYELISDIHWHKEDPWAFALRFHVETLPVGRKARLNMDVAVRRFIGKPWQDDPFLKHDVNAYVRTEGGTLRVVPYGYDKQKRDLAWDPAALANYEFASGTGLPAVREYLEDMGRYARDGSQPQILSPYAMTASWASKPSVASGASVIDKAMFFEAVAARLKDIAEPVGALDSLQLTHLKASIEEPRQADWDKDPVSARARQETWGRANRARLAHCTGRDRAVFQLIGNQDDARLLDMARAEISRFLGGEGAVDGFEVEIDNIPANDLLNRMENTGDSQAKIRWRKVAAALPEATDPTACIVVLPGAESYKPKGKDDGGDPKRALRIAFAKTGRLTQFIEPEDSKDSPEIRARVAVRDLMRQLGFVPEPARNSRGIDTSIPAIGLKVYNSGNGKARASFPYCVRQDMRSGAVTVYCPLLPDGSLPYWRALIEFARLSGSEGFPDSCKRANGMALKRMLHGIVRATGDRPELLLVNSYGRIRQRDWWPVGVPAVHEVSDVGADPRLVAARALDLDRLLHPVLEGIVELHDLAAGDQAVRLDLGEHGEAGGGAHAGQADVQLALGEDLRVDAAGIERQALRLVDGDGVGELERDLGIGTHDGGLDPVDGPALIVHLDDGLGLVDLPSVPLDADLLVHPVELDRHGVRGRVGDGALRAVDVTLLRAVHERHHAGAAAQDDPLRRHLVAV